MSGSGIRPRWRKLLGEKRSTSSDAGVRPVHEVWDDITPDTEVPPPPVAQPLVTGITTEYPTSEIVYTVEGDIVVAVTP